MCEIHREVFECHVCSLLKNHPVHEVIGNDPIVYVCLHCSEATPNILVISTQPKGNVGRLYAYKTGQLLDQQIIPGRKMSTKIWTTFDKIPNIVRSSKVFEVVKFYKEAHAI